MESDRLKASKSMDFDQFILNISALIETVWGEEWGKFTIIKPTTSDSKNVQMPQIVYSLDQAEPGLVGKDTREISPRRREMTKDTSPLTGENRHVEIKGRIMDCTVEFIIYAENNREAIDLTRSFRKLLETYKGILMKNGMQNMWFKKEYQRNDLENSAEKVASRGLVYLVRLEELFTVEHEELKRIELLMNIAMNTSELSMETPSLSELNSEVIKSTITKKDNNLLL